LTSNKIAAYFYAFGRGIVDTGVILYYLGIIVLFLGGVAWWWIRLEEMDEF